MVQPGHIGDKGESPGILYRVEKDRGNNSADDYAVPAFVGNGRDIFTYMPQQAVGGRLTG